MLDNTNLEKITRKNLDTFATQFFSNPFLQICITSDINIIHLLYYKLLFFGYFLPASYWGGLAMADDEQLLCPKQVCVPSSMPLNGIRVYTKLCGFAKCVEPFRCFLQGLILLLSSGAPVRWKACSFLGIARLRRISQLLWLRVCSSHTFEWSRRISLFELRSGH